MLTFFPCLFRRLDLLLLDHEVFRMVDRLIVGVFHPDPERLGRIPVHLVVPLKLGRDAERHLVSMRMGSFVIKWFKRNPE